MPSARWIKSAIKDTGAVKGYAVDANTGKLTPLNQQISGGSGPCHISVDATGKCLLVANYGGGNIAALPIHADGSLGEATDFIQHTGSSVNTNRQTGAARAFHLSHRRTTASCSTATSVSTKFSPIASMRMRRNFRRREPAVRDRSPGSGPRHLVFSA